jgi:hypothetical protein
MVEPTPMTTSTLMPIHRITDCFPEMIEENLAKDSAYYPDTSHGHYRTF